MQTETLPTNGFDRIKLHLLHRLISVHGYDVADAASETNAVEDLYNSADPLFEAEAALGKESFTAPVDAAMVIAFRVLADQNSN